MYKHLKLLIFSAAFILVGAGCSSGSPGLTDLTTTPPDDALIAEEALKEGGDDMEVKDKTESGVAPRDDEAVMEDEGKMMDEDEMMMEDESKDDTPTTKSQTPYYVAYTKEVSDKAFADKRPVVQYYWASWCPICRQEEPKIQKWIETSEHPIAGFRVNFDTQKDLTKKNKVPYQHTTIFFNKSGVEVERFTGPTNETTFRAALALASK